MAIRRDLTITVTDEDHVAVDVAFAGYEGEHLATRVTVVLPASWDGYYALLCWEASDGWTDESTTQLLSNPGAMSFYYDLPFNATKPGILRVCAAARTVDDGSNDFIARTEAVLLTIARSVNSDASYQTDHQNAIDDLQRQIDALTTRVDALEGA